MNWYGHCLTRETYLLARDLSTGSITIDLTNQIDLRRRFRDILQVARELGAFDSDMFRNFVDLVKKRHGVVIALIGDGSTKAPEVIVITGGIHGEVHEFKRHLGLYRSYDSPWVRNLIATSTISPWPMISSWQRLAALEVWWLMGIMELLQLEIETARTYPDLHPVPLEWRDVHVDNCTQTMVEIARHTGSVPPSFMLWDVHLESSRELMSDGFSSTWRGTVDREVDKITQDLCMEALAWKQVNHPNVAPFLGVATNLYPGRRTFCLVSPWLDKGDIVHFLRQHPRHSRKDCIIQIARGFQYLHNLKPALVHGDIRGANILVSQDNQCCLSDFGLTPIVVSPHFDEARESIRWMAPEMFIPGRNRDISPPIDIYAFACTVIEIYTRHVPFYHYPTDRAVLRAILDDNLEEFRPGGMSDALWSLLKMCWDRAVFKRPNSTELLQRLLSRELDTTRPKGILKTKHTSARE